MSAKRGAVPLVFAVGICAVLLAAAGCGTTSTKTATPASTSIASGAASPGTWTGLGATLTAWESAHPKGSGGSGSGCSGEGCYGAQVTDNDEPTYEFTAFSTGGPPEYRVTGYEQALGDGTSLEAAKADVLKLMPPDTVVTGFWVTHEDGSCASWNLQSKTLGRWFATKKVGDPRGDIGVLLDSDNSNDEPTFDAKDVSRASVGVAPERRGTSC